MNNGIFSVLVMCSLFLACRGGQISFVMQEMTVLLIDIDARYFPVMDARYFLMIDN